jgi:hypothetical protein
MAAGPAVMPMRPLLFTLLALAAGCRSFDPDLVARTERELQRGKQGFHKLEGAPVPGSQVPVPWTKGQYAVWAITRPDSKTGLTTLIEAQIEEADAEGVIVMITSLSPRLRSTARLTFTRQPHSRAEARDVLTQVIRRRGDERALTYRFHRDMPVDMRDALEPLWATLVPEIMEEALPETATSPAATMEGCRPANGEFIFAPVGLNVRALLHPAVPINGLVSATAPTGERVELIEAGWSGGGPAL